MSWSTLSQQVFPIGPLKEAQTYLNELENDPVYVQNTARLQTVIPAAAEAVVTLVYAHAKDYLALEDKRSDSVISRGQGLLVSQAFLGALLSLGGVISSRADLFVGWPLWVTSVIVAYIVIQTFLLTRCALISTGAIGYPRISSSQLANLTGGTEAQAIAELALRSILNYRRTALLNDWRFISLGAAQHSLRNTAISLGLLVMVMLYLFHNPAPKAPDSTAQIDKLGVQLDQRMTDVKNALANVAATVGAHDAKAELSAINATLGQTLARLPSREQTLYGCIGWQYYR